MVFAATSQVTKSILAELRNACTVPRGSCRLQAWLQARQIASLRTSTQSQKQECRFVIKVAVADIIEKRLQADLWEQRASICTRLTFYSCAMSCNGVRYNQDTPTTEAVCQSRARHCHITDDSVWNSAWPSPSGSRAARSHHLNTFARPLEGVCILDLAVCKLMYNSDGHAAGRVSP